MDLQTCVAFSLLRGASPSRVAASLRDTSDSNTGMTASELIGGVLAAVGLDRSAFDEARRQADRVLLRARQQDLDAIPFGDARYPPLVAAIHDPPPVLWVRGRAQALLAPSVAIVGARAASAPALAMAADLAAGLVGAGLVVVSGLARGVDAAAHAASLDAKGVTVAVLGCGADRVYPGEHRDLARATAEAGALVSELPPGTPPLRGHFPRRNRLISGLSLATVVVEASERSGSLITARCALEQGREVMAVPGLALSGRNRGAHALLKDGAKLVETADDILEELPGFGPGRAGPSSCGKPLIDNDLLEKIAAAGPCDLDELAARTGLDAATLLSRLLDLELRGLVVRAGGGRFLALPRRVVT
jgi:DNA processing protein